MEDIENKLDRDIWITKGARFNASRRLLRKHHASIFTIAVLSFYNISVSLSPELLGIGGNAQDLSIILSVFILTLSLLEANKGYNIQSLRLHQNAIDLSELYYNFQHQKKLSKKNYLNNFIKDYAQLIKNCPENHSPVDKNYFKTEHLHEFKKEFTANVKLHSQSKKPLICFEYKTFYYLWHRSCFWFSTYWLYLLLLLSPLALLHLQSN